MSNWRNTREYRIWRVGVIRRDKVCQICGTRLGRHAHHIESGAYNPELRYILDNGVCMCGNCHLRLFHSTFMGSTRVKTDRKDFNNFVKLHNIFVTKGVESMIPIVTSTKFGELITLQSPVYKKE